MKYLGGKFNIRKQVAQFLEQVRPEGAPYIVPFVGGGWVLQEMSGSRFASDACKPLITMYKALQDGWIPPDSLSREEYSIIKDRMDLEDPVTAFAGFGCSFGGKWFWGYARNNAASNYCRFAKNSLMKQLPKLEGVVFSDCDYRSFNPKASLIYCDPPYYGTTGYAAVGRFDHELFWETMREWSKDNVVVVSEYSAPEDFKCVLEIATRIGMHTKEKSSSMRVEKLFMQEALAGVAAVEKALNEFKKTQEG